MRIDGREKCLSRAFSDSRPRINTQFTQLGIQAHPLPVRGRYGFVVLGANIASITGAIMSSSLSLVKCGLDLSAVLRQKVGNIPLQKKKLEHQRNFETDQHLLHLVFGFSRLNAPYKLHLRERLLRCPRL